MKVFKDLFWYFKQEKWSYGGGVGILFLVSLLTLVPPYIIGIIIDAIATNTLTESMLMRFMGILLFIGIASYVLRYIWRILIFGSSIKLARLLRNNLYHHFTSMPSSFFQRRRTGDLMAHATNDIRAVEQTAGAGVLTLVDSLTMGGLVIITMAATISWELTLIALIPMPIMAFATSKYGSMLHKRFGVAQAAFSSLNDKVQESMSGIRVVKAFGYEEKEIEAFKEQSEDVVAKNMRVAKVDALFDPTISLIVGISFFLSIVFGAGYVINGALTIGQLTSFTVYLGLLIWPMLAFGWLFNIVERGRASYDRIRLLFEEKNEITESTYAVTSMERFDLTFRIDHLTYGGSELLKNIHAHVKEGQTLGLAGKTGSGKSILIKSLMRDFDITVGDVFIGGESIKNYSLDRLRQSIAYVPQDHFLFSATIADNIAFAKPDASYEEIIRAAKSARIHEDIATFKDGYETIVGERGVTLSGGQKQRLSIARALLSDPSILILDDSLSAVDAKTEEAILSELRGLRSGKTTIITTHRLSAIEHADLILVLHDGAVSEEGTHEELMQKDTWYRAMYQSQQLESAVMRGGDA
ncbi:ATP-binding cassette domain-containing protein [Paenalkalicoccus suaedae]|uniref:ATP-binding cassette domain-containing protein n=1 Tax=Paenalkalicoccus suaedae TaxID=2592382 RepID=A0A859FKB8_9BACI|nr:ABC transporter transmembrane domain-containing protein [Paenalkalicoccus suaedae]QKS73242.1 ATP-binding cassette domain-containing protein [Paenalkalicoccus suaedae]